MCVCVCARPVHLPNEEVEQKDSTTDDSGSAALLMLGPRQC